MPPQVHPKPPRTPKDDGDLAYALACSNLGEGLPGVEVASNGERAEFSHRGITYACIERAGRAIALTFLVDEEDREAAARLTGYELDPNRSGWFKLRLGNDPHRWRDARVSTLVGRTLSRLRTLSTLGRWQSLSGSTGAYVAAAASLVPRWAEDAASADVNDANRADPNSLLRRPWGSVLVLGTCGRLYFTPLESGGLFVRVVGREEAPEAELRNRISELPETAFVPCSVELVVEEPWVAFPTDAERSSNSPDRKLACELAPGRYRVESATLTSPNGVTLALTRLLPTAAAA